MAGRPEAEIEITDDLVHELLASQHPDLGQLSLRQVASGWDNVVFRLGERMVVRMPRREVAAQLLRNEQRWLPFLADRLPVAIPVPLRIGLPASGYPWYWSILPWFEGSCADQAKPSSNQVDVLADFLARLHRPAPLDAPRNPVRGIPIQERAQATQERMARLKVKSDLITPWIEKIWELGLSAPASLDDRWLHGDLHAQNVLVVDGRISAVIDWGDITSGDVATDLAVIWSVFEKPADRQRLLEIYGPDAATRERAMAWAVMFGVVLVDSGLVNSPRHAAQGQVLLSRLSEDARWI